MGCDAVEFICQPVIADILAGLPTGFMDVGDDAAAILQHHGGSAQTAGGELGVQLRVAYEGEPTHHVDNGVVVGVFHLLDGEAVIDNGGATG